MEGLVEQEAGGEAAATMQRRRRWPVVVAAVLVAVAVERDGTRVRVVDQPEIPERIRQRAHSDDEDLTEYAVPVRWLAQRPVSEAVSERGLFASQVTVCKLRDDRTIDVVTTALRPQDDDT